MPKRSHEMCPVSGNVRVLSKKKKIMPRSVVPMVKTSFHELRRKKENVWGKQVSIGCWCCPWFQAISERCLAYLSERSLQASSHPEEDAMVNSFYIHCQHSHSRLCQSPCIQSWKSLTWLSRAHIDDTHSLRASSPPHLLPYSIFLCLTYFVSGFVEHTIAQ